MWVIISFHISYQGFSTYYVILSYWQMTNIVTIHRHMIYVYIICYICIHNLLSGIRLDWTVKIPWSLSADISWTWNSAPSSLLWSQLASDGETKVVHRSGRNVYWKVCFHQACVYNIPDNFLYSTAKSTYPIWDVQVVQLCYNNSSENSVPKRYGIRMGVFSHQAQVSILSFISNNKQSQVQTLSTLMWNRNVRYEKFPVSVYRKNYTDIIGILVFLW